MVGTWFPRWPMDKQNCWEATRCGREVGGKLVHEHGICPASLDGSIDGINNGCNGGRICWAVAGTLCGGKPQGTLAEKRLTCLNCAFYKQVALEEGPGFLMLKPGQSYPSQQPGDAAFEAALSGRKEPRR